MRSLIPYSWNRTAPAALPEPFEALQQEMNRLFNSFGHLSGFPAAFHSNGNGNGNGYGEIAPRIDVSETEREIAIDAELPGLSEKDVDVTLSGDMLTIKGEKKTERDEDKKNYRLHERMYGGFLRQVPLPFDADAKDIAARFDKGVLHVTVKKPESIAARTARIPVKSAA